MIRVKNAVFGYNGGDPVIKGVNLELKDGDLMGILGPNGSGKSTLLGLMSGILHPRKGVVEIEGSSMRKRSRRQIARKIAVVPQESSLGFEYTVEEVVSMGRYPHMGRLSFGDPGGRRAVEEAMETTEIMELREKTVDRLSGGERQRVMIARALAQEPGILMLDEPTKNLDIRHSLDIMGLISKWNKERGLSVIAVLHDLDLASRYCRSCVLMKGGRIVTRGSLEGVLTADLIKEVFGVNARIRKRGGSMHVDIEH